MQYVRHQPTIPVRLGQRRRGLSGGVGRGQAISERDCCAHTRLLVEPGAHACAEVPSSFKPYEREQLLHADDRVVEALDARGPGALDREEVTLST